MLYVTAQHKQTVSNALRRRSLATCTA